MEQYNRGIRFRITGGARDFTLLHSAQTGPGAHPVCYPVGTAGSFPKGKINVAWKCVVYAHLQLLYCRGHVFMPCGLSKHGGNFIYTVHHTSCDLPSLYHLFAANLSQLKGPYIICIPTFVRHKVAGSYEYNETFSVQVLD
jgi:hypothetical protein